MRLDRILAILKKKTGVDWYGDDINERASLSFDITDVNKPTVSIHVKTVKVANVLEVAELYNQKLVVTDKIAKKDLSPEELEDIASEIRAAREVLQEGFTALKSALKSLPEYNSYRGYIISHLDNWINGGNPYDNTIPVILEDIEKLIEEEMDEPAPRKKGRS